MNTAIYGQLINRGIVDMNKFPNALITRLYVIKDGKFRLLIQ